MERLSGLDASFLHTESPTVHMHTIKVGVIDPSSAPGGYDFDRFVEVLGDRLHRLPPFRRRVVRVPLDLGHPVWVEDEGFQIDRHVLRMRAATPGGSAELDACIGEVASAPLPRDRPLWSITVVEDLLGGQVAFVAKMHHAMADGIAAAHLLASVMSTEVEDSIAPGGNGDPWRGEPGPGRGRLVLDALADIVRLAVRLPGLVLHTLARLPAVARARRTADEPPAAAFAGPATSFSRHLTARRRFASLALPFDDFQAVRAATGSTVNDVVLACVAGSLRRLLVENGEPVDRPLVASVPVSGETGPTDRLAGNRTSNLFAPLRVDLADPRLRLDLTARGTRAAKAMQDALGVETMGAWVDYTPPAVYRLIWRVIVPRSARPPVNVVVSNVPGPREPLYVAGAELVGLMSVGPLLEDVGLNVTVWSYRGSMHVGVLSCPDSLPEPRRVTEGIAEALAELGAAC